MNNKHVLVLALIILLLPLASAGTLKGGGTVQVNEDNPEFSQYDIVGTWSNTPTFQDTLTLSSSNLPEGYSATDTVNIVFQKPTYEQVFLVRNQNPIHTFQYHDKFFWYWNAWGTSYNENLADCKAKLDAYRQDTLGGQDYMRGTSPVLRIGDGGCQASWVGQLSNEGWYGTAVEDRINFEQEIVVDQAGTARLVRNQQEDQLTDTIPGIGQFGLDSFGTYTNAKLTDNNLRAYHSTGTVNTGKWQPFFEDDQNEYLDNYLTLYQQIKSQFDGTGEVFDRSTDEQTLIDDINTLNSRAQNVRFAAQGTPSLWSNRVDTIRSQSNLIIAEPSKSSLVADINFVLSGDTIGLIRPEGECTIRVADDTACFVETEEGRLPYTIENTGSGADSFSVSANCVDPSVTALPNQHSLNPGQRASDQLYISAKSDTTDTQTTVRCTVTCRANAAETTDTASVDACVETKENCVEGEQTAPQLAQNGDEYVVQVLSSTCAVKSVERCPVDGFTFEKQSNGQWECVESATGDVTTPPSTGDGEQGDFSVGIFVFALIIGTVFAGFTAYFLSPLKKLFTGGNVVRWVLIVAAFLAGVIGTALAVQSVVSLFSFGSLSGGLFG